MKRQQILWSILTFAAVGITAIWYAGFLDPFLERKAARRFEPERWRVASLRDRGRMARDLSSNGLLDGLTRDEVIALLGPSDQMDNESISYNVDLGYGFGSMPWIYSLTALLDTKSQRVTSVSLHD